MKTTLSNRIVLVLIAGALAAFMTVLSSCQVEDSSSSLSRDESSLGMADQFVYQLGVDLLAAGYTADQVDALQEGAVEEIDTQNLDATTDVESVSAAVLKGAMLKITDAGITGAESQSGAVGNIIQSVMESLDGRISTSSSSSLQKKKSKKQANRQLSATGDAYSSVIETLVSTAIGNLDEAGIAAGDMADAVEGTVEMIIANLSAAGLPDDDIWDLTATVVTSAVGAIDEAGVTEANYSAVITKVISGSMDGLSSLGRTDDQISEAADDIAESGVWGLAHLAGISVSESDSYISAIVTAVKSALTDLGITITTTISTAINTAAQSAKSGAFEIPNQWGTGLWGTSEWVDN